MLKRNSILLYFVSIFFFFVSCVDPFNPEFQYKEGLVYIDAFMSSTNGASFVRVSESVFEYDKHVYEFVSGADVSFRNTETDFQVVLKEQEGIYLPPDEFVARVDESWELILTLPDGRRYQSLPEIVTTPVEISEIKASYNPELKFDESEEEFLPGHFISIDIDDPPDEDNFYFWNFRSFEKLKVCQLCYEGRFRGGNCNLDADLEGKEFFVGYWCEDNCWKIRFAESIEIFSDEFTNGVTINSLPVADVPLYSKEDVVVVVQQFSISESAFNHYKVLKDIVNNNGGINAPPAAALVGNMFNPEDGDEFVLGRFTAASTTTSSVFIDRTNIIEDEIAVARLFRTECCPSFDCVVPFLDEPCSPVNFIPCTETRFKTAIPPPGWIEQ